MADPKPLMHDIYLPFSEDVLRQHFAPVLGGGHPDRHLEYFRASVENLRAFATAQRPATPAEAAMATARARQIEKDERFWIVTALLSVFREPDRVAALDALLVRCLGSVPPFDGCDTWAEALLGDLHLYFEVNLPSPESYRLGLGKNLDERVIVPYLREAAVTRGTRLEGATKVDAMLISSETGFAVIFEGKVLSDVSSGVRYDVIRNQIARNIDVMLEDNSKAKIHATLQARDPRKTCFVLITPEIFKRERETRLYGWLLPAYQQEPDLLAKHLPHRDPDGLATVGSRLGWISWEDINAVRPGACGWLAVSGSSTKT